MCFTWTRTSFLLIAVIFTGCGRNPDPKLVQVHGKVVGPKDKPIGQVVLILWPENSKKNSGASAVCEADGSFSLQCFPGNYKATVNPIRPKGGTPTHQSDGSAFMIPALYQNELTTTLTLKVPETGADSIVLKLKGDKAR
jgi:hypothetical protein